MQLLNDEATTCTYTILDYMLSAAETTGRMSLLEYLGHSFNYHDLAQVLSKCSCTPDKLMELLSLLLLDPNKPVKEFQDVLEGWEAGWQRWVAKLDDGLVVPDNRMCFKKKFFIVNQGNIQKRESFNWDEGKNNPRYIHCGSSGHMDKRI